jgi:hypothetical protein
MSSHVEVEMSAVDLRMRGRSGGHCKIASRRGRHCAVSRCSADPGRSWGEPRRTMRTSAAGDREREPRPTDTATMSGCVTQRDQAPISRAHLNRRSRADRRPRDAPEIALLREPPFTLPLHGPKRFRPQRSAMSATRRSAGGRAAARPRATPDVAVQASRQVLARLSGRHAPRVQLRQ